MFDEEIVWQQSSMKGIIINKESVRLFIAVIKLVGHWFVSDTFRVQGWH